MVNYFMARNKGMVFAFLAIIPLVGFGMYIVVSGLFSDIQELKEVPNNPQSIIENTEEVITDTNVNEIENIITEPEAVEPSRPTPILAIREKTMIFLSTPITGEKFEPESVVRILIDDKIVKNILADSYGKIYTDIRFPKIGSSRVIAFDEVNNITPAVFVEVIDRPKRESIDYDNKITNSPTESSPPITIDGPDYTPPTTTAEVSGQTLCAPDNRCYYTDIPTITFNANDVGGSGIKYVITQGNTFLATTGVNCYRNECYVPIGVAVTPTKATSVDQDKVYIKYFAVDNNGNKDKDHILEFLVDAVYPQINIYRMTVDNKDIPIGTHCLTQTKDPTQNCYPVELGVNATLTIFIVTNDRESGLKALSYKLLESYNIVKIEDMAWTDHNTFPINFEFHKKGNYLLQFSSIDYVDHRTVLYPLLIHVR